LGRGTGPRQSPGSLRRAKMLIKMVELSDGFIELWELKRLDISVEPVP
jgi:hypothetical protein